MHKNCSTRLGFLLLKHQHLWLLQTCKTGSLFCGKYRYVSCTVKVLYHKVRQSAMNVSRSNIKSNPANSACNLGVIFDQNFTFRPHISAVCSACFYHIRAPLCIRRCLDLDSAQLLATALVSSRLNYCNSLLYGIADTDLAKLQRVQNQLTCIVTKSLPFVHSVPVLRSLHWSPIKFRILFKMSLLTYKTLHEKQPVYLHSMLAASFPSRSLRSNKGISVLVPRAKTNTGERAFHLYVPSVWNYFPLYVHSAISVATLKKHLKTYIGLFPIDTSMADGLLLLRNCFIDFAVKQ